MILFECKNYKKYVILWIDSRPKKGRGEYRRIAELLNIHTSYVSQIFNGDRDITEDQAWLLCGHLSLNQLETEYFLALVRYNVSSHHAYKEKCKKDLEVLRLRSLEIKNRVRSDWELTDSERATFYSHWYFSAVRQITSMPQFQTPESIADELNLPRAEVVRIIEFLVSTGLCKEEGGKIKKGPASTHLAGESPFASRQHINWRVKAFEKIGGPKTDAVFFTSPLTISTFDAEKLRKKIVDFIDEAMKVVEASKHDEELRCLNIDWFKVNK